jgi:Phytanoyl-CoA dioxygenase (PhyH)
MQLTAEETNAGRLSSDTLYSAVDQVRNNGFVLFERVLPADLLADMHSTFSRLFEAHVAQADPNRGARRYQMHVPFAPPFCDERVIASAFVLPIVEALLGQDCICHYFASDTPLPGSEYQDVHPDIFSLFPETPIVLPTYSVVVNIPLVDARDDNGPLEIWPGGSHHYVADRARVPSIAAAMHSETVKMPSGSMLIRDSRMWHRGTPNRSTASRPNFTLIYSRYWLRLRYRPIPISRRTYGSLSERARRLFRLEAVGATETEGPELTPEQFYGAH